MYLILVYAVTLLIAVLVSRLAERSILSTSVLFLVAGFIVGRVLDQHPFQGHEGVVERFAELALFSVLFTDGMRLNVNDLRRDWLLPARALIRGMPLTIIGIALLGRYLAGMGWGEALLMGAALSPTDPVFVAAIFRVHEVPDRLKHLLNVESGLNDGLALPLVVVLLSVVSPHGSPWGEIVKEMSLGLAIGIAVPWLAIRLERSRFFGATATYQPLNAFAIGLLVLGLCYVTKGNLFLAGFSAGVCIATVSEEVRDAFHGFGELIAELLKLAALLVFAILITPRLFTALSWGEIIFVVASVFVVRLVIFQVALVPSTLTRREKLVAGWFGPKGFASVVYGFMILNGGFPGAPRLAHLMGVAVTASILVYSSTDILVARWFRRHGDEAVEEDQRRAA